MLSMLIVVLIAVITTALVRWGTPPVFIPLTKGEDDRQGRSVMVRQN
jgi:hypothetical protein